MNRIITGLIILLLALSAQISSAQSDTTFFDLKWHKTNREHAKFFRPKPISTPDGFYEVHDHYMTGGLQMDGYTSSLENDTLEGYTTYYDSSGRKTSEGYYKRNYKTGLWKFYFAGSERLHMIRDFGDTVTKYWPSKYYDSATGMKRAQGTYYNGSYKTGNWTYYYRNDTTVKAREYFTDSLSWTVEYYDSLTHLITNKNSFEKGMRNGRWIQYDTTGRHILGYKTYKNNFLDGELEIYDPVKWKILTRGQYNHGDKTGTWEIFYAGTDLLKSKETYSPDGTYIGEGYDSSGNVISRGIKKRARREAQWTYYYKGTNIMSYELTITDTFLNGPARYYYLNGNKISEGRFEHNNREGTWQYFAQNGNLKGVEEYKKGLRNGKCVYYDTATGKLITKGSYKNNLRDGGWRRYDQQGGWLTAKENYIDGKYDGERTTYDETGKVLMHGYYKAGFRHGDWTTYYPGSKQTETRRHYKNDLKDGEQIDYFDNGQLRRREFYQDGKMSTGKCYSTNGTEEDYYPHHIPPSFPGDINTYTNTYLQYPPAALSVKREGAVRIGFTVDENGALSNIHLIKGIGGLCDEAALNFMSDMPKWNPAIIEKKPHKEESMLTIRYWASFGSVQATLSEDIEFEAEQ
ncbi:energy transducer TonB [Chitinophagaceae bacterium MMS25-I14]